MDAGQSFYRKRQNQRAFLERMDDYIERLGNFEAEAERRMDEMVDALLKIHPSAQECCDFACSAPPIFGRMYRKRRGSDAAPWIGNVAPAM